MKLPSCAFHNQYVACGSYRGDRTKFVSDMNIQKKSDNFDRQNQSLRSQQAREAQQMWDCRFAEFPWPEEPDRKLVELAGELSPGTCVDLGCGPGRNAIWLASRGWAVTGVDASSVGLDQAQSRAREIGVSLITVNQDILAYSPDEPVDLVVVANIHLVEPARTEFFTLCAQMLKSQGHLFVTGHHLKDLGRTGPPDSDKLYTIERIQDSVAGITEIVEIIELAELVKEPGPDGYSETDVYLWARRQ